MEHCGSLLGKGGGYHTETSVSESLHLGVNGYEQTHVRRPQFPGFVGEEKDFIGDAELHHEGE